MSGGVDKHIDDFFQGEAQRAAVEAIRTEFLGELPVGVALVLQLPRPRTPWLVVAPTMRVPGNAANTLNAYLAMRAALVAVTRHNERSEKKIMRLAIPGLCTGVGGMSPAVSAMQMRAAYDTIIGGAWQEIAHPAMAPFALGSASGRHWTLE
jgi:O-acetyl-ADP-ribose deacetylase (regulator of RNase III)